MVKMIFDKNAKTLLWENDFSINCSGKTGYPLAKESVWTLIQKLTQKGLNI